MKKIADIVNKAIDYATIATLITFMVITGVGTIVATALAIIEKDPFNLIGAAACGVIALLIRSILK